MIESQKGFTIPELLVSISIAGVLLVSFGVAVFNLYTNSIINNTRGRLNSELSSIATSFNEKMRFAAEVRNTNLIVDTNSPVNGWQTDPTQGTLVLATPVLDPGGDFVIDSSSGDPYLNEEIYFVSGRSLYKRFLANVSAPNNSGQTTCPVASSSSYCPSDILFTKDMQSLTYNFYDQNNILIIVTDYSTTKSVEPSVLLSDVVFGTEVEAQSTLQVTLRN